jgi:hypothetical protein
VAELVDAGLELGAGLGVETRSLAAMSISFDAIVLETPGDVPAGTKKAGGSASADHGQDVGLAEDQVLLTVHVTSVPLYFP